jgi:hypothetical protein
LCWGDHPRELALSGEAAGQIIASADAQLSISRETSSLPTPFTANEIGSYAFHLETRPVTGRWSGATQAKLSVFVERPYLLTLSFDEIFNLLDARWINDRWLYFRVALGRTHAVDYVLDVEAETLVLRQAIEHLRLARQQAIGSCADPSFSQSVECHPTCHRLQGPDA